MSADASLPSYERLCGDFDFLRVENARSVHSPADAYEKLRKKPFPVGLLLILDGDREALHGVGLVLTDKAGVH